MGKKSPFPTDFLGVDLFYAGAWQPLGDDLDQSGVSVSHGVRSEGGSADVSSLSFTVTNSDGTYSPRNPVSPLYDLVGGNTPARARVDLGAPWLDLEAPGARATTPDDLDFGTDGDVRWWGYRDSWRVAADLISKWDTAADQRSWIVRAEADGTLTFFWSNNGTNFLEARSEVAIPAWAGEIAIRVTIDSNNGAGGRTITFEYADALSLAVAPDTGSWISLGDPVEQAGTTGVFNSTAALTLGKEPTSSAAAPPQRVYGWSVRSGLDGGQLIRSQAITSDLPVGVTSFDDDQGRTWTVTDGSVSNTHVLGTGEVAEWPVDWNTKGEPSVKTEVEAAGVTRRLGQGAEAIESVLYRAISATSDSTDLHAYWPMEDGSDATSFGAAIGDRAMGMSSAIQPAAYADFRGSAPIPVINTGRARGVVGSHAGTGEVQVRWVQIVPGSAITGTVTIMRIELVGGTIGWIDLKLRDDGLLGIFGYDHDGVELSGSTLVATSTAIGKSLRVSVELNQNGSKVAWRFSFLQAFQESGETFGQDFTFDHTLGRVVAVVVNPQFEDLGGTALGHVTVGTEITSLFDGVQADILIGHIGEDAGIRLVRLAAENGVTMTTRARQSADMGEQQEETLLDLLAEAAKADGGILHDDPRALGLRYRSLHSMGDQPAVEIPYTDNKIIPFKPTDDDRLIRNRVTVSRPNGTRITHELTTGRMSTQPPEDGGVGLYDESLTRNLFDDDLVDRTGSWRLHIGTWDEGRYPKLGVDLAHPELLADPLLTRALLSLTIGDRIVISDPPPWLPPRSVDVLVVGIQAEVTPLHLRLRWTCLPARPYRVAYWNAGHRWSGEGTVLRQAASSGTNVMALTVPDGVTWTHADGDYDITIDGEVMTVIDVDAVAPPSMTVIRSVNGVVKSHAAGAAVALADPSFYAR